MKVNRFLIAILSIVLCVNLSSCEDDNPNSGDVYDIHVEEAGTLHQLMPPPHYESGHYNTFKCLKLTGEINQQDIYDAVQLFYSAEAVDMGGVTVVEGEYYDGRDWIKTPANKLDMSNSLGSARTLILPPNLEEYENGGGTYFTSIKLPSTLKKLGKNALWGSDCLKKIEIPQSVSYIGESAFSGCYNLVKITFPNNITEIKSGMFSGCSSLSSFDIPNKVTKIEEGAFFGCINLKNITIPTSVIDIESMVFMLCENLEVITIPKNVKKIGTQTFSGCRKLKEVHVKNPIPPTTTINLFGRNEQYIGDNIYLYVPKGSKELYQKDVNWQNVHRIIEE